MFDVFNNHLFSFLLDQKRNKKLFTSYILFGVHESSISSLHFLVGQISFRICFALFAYGSGLKEAALAALKQLFFLRILQTFDARLQKLRTSEPRK